MSEINDLQLGQIIYLATGTRHDAEAFPYAVVTHQAQAVEGGGIRYQALLVDCIFKPTRFAWATVYGSEIAAVSQCPPLTPDIVVKLSQLLERAVNGNTVHVGS